MTDRVRTLTVVLERDTRTDDAEETIRAISMIRGVVSVEKGPVVSLEQHHARLALSADLRCKLHDLVDSVFDGDDHGR